MKRTCNNCRALNGESCGLGYKVVYRGKGAKDHTGYFEGMRPTTNCPKPLTYRKLMLLPKKWETDRD